jgi:hemerythrin-like domain-containing protein
MLASMPRDGSLDAFGMLRNSHRRLRERLDELREATSGPLDDERRAQIDDVLGFLGRAVARHEADEEASLFPRLASHPELVALAAKLTDEHGTQAELAEALGYALDADDVDTLRQLTADLIASYERHLEREERELFPAAERLLDAEARAAMLAEMDRRRGR